MKQTKSQKEMALVLSGVLMGIAIGSYLEGERASRSRLQSRIFDLEMAAKRREAGADEMPPIPVKVVQS